MGVQTDKFIVSVKRIWKVFVWIGFIWLRLRIIIIIIVVVVLASTCKNKIYLSGCIKRGEFVDRFSNY